MALGSPQGKTEVAPRTAPDKGVVPSMAGAERRPLPLLAQVGSLQPPPPSCPKGRHLCSLAYTAWCFITFPAALAARTAGVGAPVQEIMKLLRAVEVSQGRGGHS